MKTLRFSLIVCLSLFAIPVASFAQEIQWQTNVETATEMATAENKLVLLHFEADWCRPCKSLETFVFKSPLVQSAMRKNVVPVKIDVDANPDMVKEFGVSGVPFDVTITPKGRVVAKRTSPRDASTYADMINSLDNVIHCLNNGHPGLQENLKQMVSTAGKQKVIRNESFRPDAPSHKAPKYSRGSFELNRRKRVVNNPYAAMAKNNSEKKPAQLTKNEFVAANEFIAPKTQDPKRTVSLDNDKSGFQEKSVAANVEPAKQQKEIKNHFVSNSKTKPANNQEFDPRGTESTALTKLAGQRTQFGGTVAGKTVSQDLASQPVPNLTKETIEGSTKKMAENSNPGQFMFDRSLNSVAERLIPESTTESQEKISQYATTESEVDQDQYVKQADPENVAQGNHLFSAKIKQQASIDNNDFKVGSSNQIAVADSNLEASANAPAGSELVNTDSTKRHSISSESPLGKMLENPTEEQQKFQVKGEAKIVINQPKSNLKPSMFEDAPTASQPIGQLADATEPSSPLLRQPQALRGKQSSDRVADERATTAKPKFALDGKCPVDLLKSGQWVDGNPQWGCVHRGKTYLFSSEANLREFQTDPDTFSPLLAGFDPVVFHKEGELVDGTGTHGVFMGKSPNLRVVLFSSAKTRNEFQKNPKAYINTIRQAMNLTGESSANILR